MSYILDALKKSDSERQQRQGPALASVHQQHYFHHRSGQNWGMLLLLGFIVALGFASFWLYHLGYLQIALPAPVAQQTRAATAAVLEDPVQIEAPAPSAQTTPSPDVAVVAPQARSLQSNSIGDSSAAGAPVADVMPSLANIRELWQLPSAQRAGIPPLEFSLHVYSSQLDQRSIIINNRMMREGEYVNPELLLKTITPDGVVMKYRNEYFRVRIVDSW